MTTTLNASTAGAGGFIATSDNSGSLALQTAGTTAVTIDTNQRAAFVAGTAALPAITTTGDTNTGIFFPAADTIAFSEGGAEIARFDSSGNLKLTNLNNIASITQTAISLTGGTAGSPFINGQSVNVITANSTTRGILIVGSTQNCSAIFFINASAAVNLSSQTTNETRFSITSGSSNTANVFVSGSNIVLQNNIQASRDFYVTYIGQI